MAKYRATHEPRAGAGKDPGEESAAWPPATDEQTPERPMGAAEVRMLMDGDMRRCLYCLSLYGHKPGCCGADVHEECEFCHNICGHRSSTCPGRYL